MIEIALDAVKKAEKELLNFKDNPIIISEKKRDIKTKADLVSNKILIDSLSKTNIPLISEEIPSNFKTLPEVCWIIDPLDGTYNFSRQYPFYAISVSLWKKGTPFIGIVRDFANKKLYVSQKENKTKLNGKEIGVSYVKLINQATINTGFPSGFNLKKQKLQSFIKQVLAFKKVRSVGSAAIMLAQVAEGICDVYYEREIYLWDVAAGLSLVKEAGGFIFWVHREEWKFDVIATNRFLFEEVKKNFSYD